MSHVSADLRKVVMTRTRLKKRANKIEIEKDLKICKQQRNQIVYMMYA